MWIRRFNCFRLASAWDKKEKVTQVNTLIYAKLDEAADIMTGFPLTDKDKKDYDVKIKVWGTPQFAAMPHLNGLSSKDSGRMTVKVCTTLSLRCTA